MNLCINNLDDDAEDGLNQLFARTSDDFGMTLSSNKLSDDSIERLHSKIKTLHKNNVDLQIEQAQGEGSAADDLVIDQYIHLKRLAV